MKPFTARLQPVPHGGLFVAVPDAVAAAAGLEHGSRVRGTVNGVGYRSSLMKYSGVFHLGVHQPVARAAEVKRGDTVSVTLERDVEPLPEDTTPPDLQRALEAEPRALASWEKLAPAVRRGFVKSVQQAKQLETRDRRVAGIVRTLRQGVPARRTWAPPDGSKKTRRPTRGRSPRTGRRARKPRR